MVMRVLACRRAVDGARVRDRELQECRGKPEAPDCGQGTKNRPAHVNEYG